MITIQPLKGPPEPVNITTFSTLTPFFREFRGVVMSIWTGKLQCTVVLTLTANAATTTLTDSRISRQSSFSFDPITANAATEKAAGTLYALEANRGTGSVTITHANSAQTDRTYIVKIIG